MSTRTPFDVVVLGEVLVEVSTNAPFGHGVPAALGVSGDALNVAAASAAAGARTGLLAVLPDDSLGRAIAGRIAELGVSTELLLRRPGQQGVYLTHSDPSGQREFAYARRGSVGSSLSTDDVDARLMAEAGAVVASGIACAISPGARAAVAKAAECARRFVFDPNYRPSLTSLDAARANLADLAPRSFLVTPSYPGETAALLGADSPAEAASTLRRLGAQNVAVTCGAEGIHLDAEGSTVWIPSVPAPHVVDQTGAGDSFIGTLTARLVLGDSLEAAGRFGAAASSLAVGGKGGTGFVPSFEQTRAHAGSAVAEASWRA